MKKKFFILLTIFLTGIHATWAEGTGNREEYLFQEWAASGATFTSVPGKEVSKGTGNIQGALMLETAPFGEHNLNERFAIVDGVTSVAASADYGLTFVYGNKNVSIFSILDLKQGDKVTVKFYSDKDINISSGNVTYTNPNGNAVTLTETKKQRDTEKYFAKLATYETTFTMTADGALDFLTHSDNVTLRIMSVVIEKDIYDILFHSTEANEAYIVRKNTTEGKFGTICLPFASAVPENATVYSIVYKNEQSTELYLQEENVLEAGIGYVYKSTDANDICFNTYTEGAIEILDAPITDSKALVGTFTELAPDEEFTGDYYYLLHDNSWVKVGDQYIGIAGAKGYRAFLDLAQVEVFPSTSSISPLMVTMRLPGGATGVEALEVLEKETEEGVYYTLTGQRVTNPTKGVYIKNGKKVTVK